MSKSENVSIDVVVSVPGIELIRNAVNAGDKFASACRAIVPALIGKDKAAQLKAHDWIVRTYTDIQSEYKYQPEDFTDAKGNKGTIDGNATRRGNATAVLRNALRRAGEKFGVWVKVGKKDVTWGELTLEDARAPAIGNDAGENDGPDNATKPDNGAMDAEVLAYIAKRVNDAAFRAKLAQTIASNVAH